MCGNHESGLAGNIAGCLLGAVLDDEAAETTKIYGLTFDKRSFYSFHKRLDDGEGLHFLDTSLLGDLVNDVCFSHFCLVLEFGMQKYYKYLIIKKENAFLSLARRLTILAAGDIMPLY